LQLDTVSQACQTQSLQLCLIIALQSSYCTVLSQIHRQYTIQYSLDHRRSLFDLATTSSLNHCTAGFTQWVSEQILNGTYQHN